jgi:hypothetical protein
MPKQTSIEFLDMYEVLQQSPFPEKRIPSQGQIRTIQHKVKEPAPSRRKKFIWQGIAALLCFILLIAAWGIATEIPGGLADRHWSQAMGMDETMRIPLGRTPVEAVQKFRHFSYMQVVHQEQVEGGMLLFIKRYYQKDGNDLQVEYVRKTYWGWKWVMGGGFGTSRSYKPALDYMVMTKYEGIQTPFPLAYGDVLDSTVKSIIVTTQGEASEKVNAKLTESETGHTIWFAFLPTSAAVPYEIEALNAKGDIIAQKIINDPRDSGSIAFSVN